MRSFISTIAQSLFCMVLAAFLGGCAAKTFTLDFELSPEISATYTLSYYASDAKQGFFVESAVSLTRGKAEQEFPLINPTLLFITSGSARVAFYAERGDRIKITGNEASPYSWTAEGNDINRQWSEWRRENKAVLSARNPADVNRAVARFVNANPDNPLSTLMLLTDFNRREDEKLFRTLWNKLGNKALEQKWIDITGRNDMPGGSPNMADSRKVKSIALKSLGRGADTIRSGKTPVFLYFWRRSDPDHEKMLDSLKAMRRRNPDSTKFVIADVCFDPDSLSWKLGTARDSLFHTIRAWNPLGEADPAMRELGVERTPFVIKYNIP